MREFSQEEKKLQKLLDNVKDSYEGFSLCGVCLCRSIKDGAVRLMKILEENPDITSSEVVDIVSDMRGCKRVGVLES